MRLRHFFCMFLAVLCSLVFAQAERKVVPGDKLKVTCTEETAVSGSYEVTDDGLILVTFLGQVKVQGLTAPQAADHIAKRLMDERIVRKATVSVEFLNNPPVVNPPVVDPPVTNQPKVKILGEVKNSVEMDFKAGMRLADVIRRAEPLPNADLTKILVKNLDGRETTLDFSRFDPATNVNNPEMRPGDEVTFPSRSVAPPTQGRIFIIGGVQRPGMINFVQGMTLRQAVEAAGGFSTTADKGRIRIERENTAVQVIDLSLPGTDSPLQANDQIIVEVLSQKRFVQVNGLVKTPGLIEFHDGLTLSRAIFAAGGLKSDARTNEVLVKRQGSESEEKVNLDEIERGYRGDFVLQPGDTIKVNSSKKGNGKEIAMAAGALLLFFLFGK